MAKKSRKKANQVGKGKQKSFTVTARKWSEEQFIASFIGLGL